MGATIKDIARQAGVSIATVSHVINKTRYVSPDLVARVEAVIRETGYDAKLSDKAYKARVGKLSEIAYVFPNMESTVYAKFGNVLSQAFADEGFTMSGYVTLEDAQREKQILSELLANKRIAGIVLVPTGGNQRGYAKLMHSGLPFVCLERGLRADGADCVMSENMEAIYRGTQHLIKNGHERIGILIDGKKELMPAQERLEGYRRALEEFGLEYDESLVFRPSPGREVAAAMADDFTEETLPTAFIACSNALTLELLQAIGELGLEYPKDVSVVGFGDDAWCSIVNPPLTTLTQDTSGMAGLAAAHLLQKINGEKMEACLVRLPVSLTIRKSTRSIERGPMGERAIQPEQLVLTDAEIEALQKGNYKVGISFHYSGTEWTRLHERAIRDTLGRFGVKVVTVTEAHFDPDLQIAQLEGMRMQKLDAIISMPADEQKTAQKYKELSKATKLVLIGNVPIGFKSEDYCAVVSVNERENGQNAGRILGDYFRKREQVKVGLITHGAPFFITRQRDFSAEQVLIENYTNIEVVAQESFYRLENAYGVCKRMLRDHPEIEGLYVSWERPALEVIRALGEMGRTDVSISTVDLDFDIASYMAKGEMVRGLSAQRPYEQGAAAALATAHALLGKTEFRYIGVQPLVVLPRNLKKAWTDIMHTAEPDFIKEMKQKR